MTLDVTPAELGVYLGRDVDEARGQLVIDLATQLCQSILSPLPDTAKAVVIAVATRAYSNPLAVQQQTIGPTQASYGGSQYSGSTGGLYLTRGDKATLRRLAGRSSAFSIDMLPPGAGECLPPWDRYRYPIGCGVDEPDDSDSGS